MLPSPILSSVIVLVLWTLAMCVWLYATRIQALKKHNLVYDPRRPSEEFHTDVPECRGVKYFKIVEMHGGWIWVVSTPGKGSTFQMELPTRAEFHKPVQDALG